MVGPKLRCHAKYFYAGENLTWQSYIALDPLYTITGTKCNKH